MLPTLFWLTSPRINYRNSYSCPELFKLFMPQTPQTYQIPDEITAYRVIVPLGFLHFTHHSSVFVIFFGPFQEELSETLTGPAPWLIHVGQRWYKLSSLPDIKSQQHGPGACWSTLIIFLLHWNGCSQIGVVGNWFFFVHILRCKRLSATEFGFHPALC